MVYINDVKKLIALSTINNLRIIMFFLFIRINIYIYIYMIIHALFKSLIFLCIGVFIYMNFDIQDIRLIGFFF